MKEMNAIVLNYDNIDTDIIIPKQFLKTIDKNNLGQYAFYEWRYDSNGNKKNTILNNNENKNFNVLITKENFGCGSSREHAVWSLIDYGFETIIASSFSDIFYRNWLNNMKLPIVLEKSKIEEIINSEIESIKIDLKNKFVKINNTIYYFEISKKMQSRLLENIDEIDYTMNLLKEIEKYEFNHNK